MPYVIRIPERVWFKYSIKANAVEPWRRQGKKPARRPK